MAVVGEEEDAAVEAVEEGMAEDVVVLGDEEMESETRIAVGTCHPPIMPCIEQGMETACNEPANFSEDLHQGFPNENFSSKFKAFLSSSPELNPMEIF